MAGFAIRVREEAMKELGKWLAIFGVGSMILNAFGMEFRILFWLDLWGPQVGWAIRIGMTVLGAVLVFVGARSQGAPASTA
jgi:hypothetical protein